MKHLKNIFLTLVLVFFPLLVSAKAEEAEWTFLIYAQAKNSLSSFADKNFRDMAKIGSSDKLNILVQWYQFGQNGVCRYKIEKGKMVLDACLPNPTDGNNAQDLVEAMRWAVSKYPAKNYCLDLWNHGIGILDPVWGSSLFVVNPRVLNSPRIQIEGVTVFNNDKSNIADNVTDNEKNSHEIDLEAITSLDFDPESHHFYHRGILFNEQSKTYMDNQSLSKALSTIKTDILNNKKIDILAMDACLMAMVEVGYQVRHYAHYLVGSQEVELAYGWNYANVLQQFSNSSLSPFEAVNTIVEAYESHYKPKIQFYTQSAIDLGKIEQLKNALDEVAINIATCKAYDKNNFFKVIKTAREKCVQFSAASYVDLHSFLLEFSKQLLVYVPKAVKKEGSAMCAFDALQLSLERGMEMIESTVIANVTGNFLKRARGLSIYFPHNSIDGSYIKTEFAQESPWVGFLQDMIQAKM